MMFLRRLIVWLLNADYQVWRWWWNLRHWRLNVAFWAGAILAFFIIGPNPAERLRWILAGGAFAGCIIGGWIWDDRNVHDRARWAGVKLAQAAFPLKTTSVTIRAILFDAAGTLIYLPRGVGWHYREVAARHGIELDEKRLGAAFREAFKTAGPRVAAGISGADDDKLWWSVLVRRVLAACGEAPGDAVFNGMFEELYARFAQPGVWALYPEAAAVLEALHGRYKLGVVSNFDRRLYPVLEHLGVRRYFEAIVISSELGVDKPDGRMFAAALAALEVTPRETIHAGDDPEQDWRAAEAAGLHVYRVDRPSIGLDGLPACAERLST